MLQFIQKNTKLSVWLRCLSLFIVEINSSDTICIKYHASYVVSLKNLRNVDLDTIFQLQHVKFLCFKHCHRTILNYITVNLLLKYFAFNPTIHDPSSYPTLFVFILRFLFPCSQLWQGTILFVELPILFIVRKVLSIGRTMSFYLVTSQSQRDKEYFWIFLT